MSIFAISDLHLSLGEADKPMNIFGEIWENHTEKIKQNWIKQVKKDDLVLLPGDFSWSMYLQDTATDFAFLNELPGKKLLLKGNHDYWWSTVTRMRHYLKEQGFSNIDFIYNNSYEWEQTIITGTRGWNLIEQTSEDEKIYARELERLKRSLQDGRNKYGQDKSMVTCMHYPPIKEGEISDFVRVMMEYRVTTCLYGHLHGPSQKFVIQGNHYGIDFKMVSCDYTGFQLIKIN